MTPSSPPEPLPMRWVVILMTAAVMASLTGGLTFLQTTSWPGALLAALSAGGLAVPALHHTVGR